MGVFLHVRAVMCLWFLSQHYFKFKIGVAKHIQLWRWRRQKYKVFIDFIHITTQKEKRLRSQPKLKQLISLRNLIGDPASLTVYRQCRNLILHVCTRTLLTLRRAFEKKKGCLMFKTKIVVIFISLSLISIRICSMFDVFFPPSSNLPTPR